jgi:hypothetical protein
MGERPPVAVPERGQIHAGGETAERVPRVRQGHVERIDHADAKITLIAPVDLGLSTRQHLESAIQPGERVLILLGKLRSDPWPGLGGEHLDPLIMAGEAIVTD